MKKILLILVFTAYSIPASAQVMIKPSQIVFTNPQFINPTFTGTISGPTQTDCTAVTYNFTGRLTTGLNSHGVNTWNLCGGGTLGLSGNTTTVTISLPVSFSADGTMDIGASASGRPNSIFASNKVEASQLTLTSGGSILKQGSNGVFLFRNNAESQSATLTVPTGTGNIIPITVASGRLVAQTAAQASVSTFTAPASDGTYEVSANILVTTATTHAFTVTCAYTDEGNTARTITLPFVLVAGSAIVNSVANANGTVPYIGIPLHIRVKASTAITIATTGTFTTVTYNVEGYIKKLS
jgi:hypothetical protein